MSPSPLPTAVARYHSKVDKRGPDDCWEWTAGRFTTGYGAFKFNRKQLHAHRYGYELLIGPIPDGLIVLHTCDNPPCQNPNHWTLGTHKDNSVDREQKGRGRYRTVGPLPPKPKRGRARGQTNSQARLTEADVQAIRRLSASGLPQRTIADRFTVSQATISAIINGTTWKHVSGPLGAKRNGNARLSEVDVRAIRRMYADGTPGVVIAKTFATTTANISRIALRQTWTHIPEIIA